MTPIRRFDAPLAVLGVDDIDTDQIIPARFLTTTERVGLGRHCFADWRLEADGRAKRDFVLDRVPPPGVLLAGRNFGCGSSREHAPWALLDAGIRAVVSTRIADIFRGNALKNGLLPIEVDDADWQRLARCDARTVIVDLERQRIELPDGERIAFAIEAFARQCLLRGVDQLGYLLAEAAAIEQFEAARAA